MNAHEVVENGPTHAVCRCGEKFEADSFDRARLDHVRHALANRTDDEDDTPAEEEPF